MLFKSKRPALIYNTSGLYTGKEYNEIRNLAFGAGFRARWRKGLKFGEDQFFNFKFLFNKIVKFR